MNIQITVIPHKDQRYSTVGDWVFNIAGNLDIRVSDLGDWRYNVLIAIHELVEVVLCKERGITQELVDRFDIQYEKMRPTGDVSSEPGDDTQAPYKREHCTATGVERILAAELGVDWKTYEDALSAL